MILVAAFGAEPARAQCPNDTPQDPFDANNNPTYLQVCHNLQGGSCPQPLPPELREGVGLAQEVVLAASSSRAETEVWWQGQVQTSTGAWVDIWPNGFRSVQDAPYDLGEEVVFGVPGLKESGANHRFRVAFCNGGNCLCYSDWTSYNQTGPFTDLGPRTPDTEYQQIVEETFSRRVTDPKCAPDSDGDGQPDFPVGDGLGPDGVWLDCMDQSAHGAWVSEVCDTSGGNCIQAAEVTPTSAMGYTRAMATSDRAYTDILIRARMDGGPMHDVYNLQVEAWRQMGTWDGSPALKSYAVKVSQNVRNCTSPTLFLVKLPDEYQWAACGQGNPPYELDENVYFQCPEYPDNPIPLGIEDPAYPGWSKPAWMRIQMLTTVSEGLPIIKGWLAWDCPDGQDISQCQHICYHERTDEDPNNTLNPTPTGGHGWGASFHDKHYLVDRFEAGAASSTRPE